MKLSIYNKTNQCDKRLNIELTKETNSCSKRSDGWMSSKAFRMPSL